MEPEGPGSPGFRRGVAAGRRLHAKGKAGEPVSPSTPLASGITYPHDVGKERVVRRSVAAAEDGGTTFEKSCEGTDSLAVLHECTGAVNAGLKHPEPKTSTRNMQFAFQRLAISSIEWMPCRGVDHK